MGLPLFKANTTTTSSVHHNNKNNNNYSSSSSSSSQGETAEDNQRALLVQQLNETLNRRAQLRRNRIDSFGQLIDLLQASDAAEDRIEENRIEIARLERAMRQHDMDWAAAALPRAANGDDLQPQPQQPVQEPEARQQDYVRLALLREETERLRAGETTREGSVNFLRDEGDILRQRIWQCGTQIEALRSELGQLGQG